MSASIRLAILDPHPLFRFGILCTLEKFDECKVIAEGAGSDDAFRIGRQHAPDVMVMDLHSEFTPELVCRLSGELRATRIIIFTVLADEDQVVGALRAGAAGYMLKAASGAELIESVRRVHKGESYVFPPLAARLMGLAVKSRPKPDLFSGLTVREEQILDYLSRGLSNKEIGRELDLSEKTIKHYLSGLLQKLHLRNRVEAALAAQSRPGKSLRALSFRHVSQQPLSP